MERIKAVSSLISTCLHIAVDAMEGQESSSRDRHLNDRSLDLFLTTALRLPAGVSVAKWSSPSELPRVGVTRVTESEIYL
jgi:hypothetical protein